MSKQSKGRHGNKNRLEAAVNEYRAMGVQAEEAERDELCSATDLIPLVRLLARQAAREVFFESCERRRSTGPSARTWGASTVHGNRRRGTGILNNELYVGRHVWNRLRYVKDPDTGKRISRPNPEDKWIIQEVPELSIVDADLWQRVKDRQSALEIAAKTIPAGKSLIDRRRPRYLFSGLIKCGCCGGGFSMISQSLLGCSTARNKNTYDNRLTIKREVVEQRILTVLRERLIEPALFAEFCQEFTKEMNRLRMDATASLAGKRSELATIERQLQKLLDALLDDGDSKTEAAEILRTLIDAIILTPEDGELSVYLKGDLAGILTLAQNKTKPLAKIAKGHEHLAQQVSLVAGVGFEPTERQETGKELAVRVRYDKGVTSHIGPESCVGIREGVGEALTGEHVGQPLSRESKFNSGADAVVDAEGNTDGCASVSARPTRRGLRPWHAWTLLVRELGDLMVGQGAFASAWSASGR